MRHGDGLMNWSSNVKYEGKFNQDCRHQVIGTIWFMTGEIYEGGWFNNML